MKYLYIDIDECIRDTHECDDNASCTNTRGDYNCTCDVGYSGDGFDCEGKEVVVLFYFNIFLEFRNIKHTSC